MICCAALFSSMNACLPSQPTEPIAPEASVLSLRPSTDVGPMDTVVLTFSLPVTLSSEAWPIAVYDHQNEPIAVDVGLSESGTELALAPRETWPMGQVLSIAIGPGFYDENGRPLSVPRRSLSFETAMPSAVSPELALRHPPAGSRAPLNLQWIALTALGIDPLPEEVLLSSETESIIARVERVAAGGVLLARLPQHRGRCDPLCPETRYRLELPAEKQQGIRVWGEIQTATVSDALAPALTSTSVTARGDRVTLEVGANEPVLLEAKWIAADGSEAEIPLPLVAATCTYVEPPSEELSPDADYVLSVRGMDIAGNVLPPISVAVRTPPRVEVMISEIVPSPFHDWNDSDGGGLAYDARPGTGAVTDSDEWIELINRSVFPIDLRTAGLSVRVRDTSPTEMAIDGAAALYFGSGGERASWWPGEALVFRPRGAIAQRAFTLEIASGSRLLDSVSVGGVEGAVAASGAPPDLEHESLARDRSGQFRWCAASPGDPLPPQDCR
jgi:hypothetical protein